MTTAIMQTASGAGFDLQNPRDDQVNWKDVANALSRVCRFNGHLPLSVENYTVAQHCCLVSDLLPDDFLKAYGLLHDAHEAYFGDWISPLKQAFETRDIRVVEFPIEKAIYAAARLLTPRHTPIAHKIKHADLVVLATERRDLLAESTVEWGALPEPMDQHIEPWSRLHAYEEWLRRLERLVWPYGPS